MRSILFVFLFIYSTREGKNLVVVACRLTLRYIQGDETIKYEGLEHEPGSKGKEEKFDFGTNLGIEKTGPILRLKSLF